MKNFTPNSLSLLCVLFLFSVSVGCGTDDDGLRPSEEDPTGNEGTECRENFVYQEVQDTCLCPEGNLLIDELVCRPPQPGDWYSDMAGCYMDLGIIINLDDRRETYNPNTGIYHGQYHLLTTSQNAVSTNYSTNTSFRRYPESSSIQTDSIYFDVFFPAYYAEFIYDDDTGNFTQLIQFVFRGYYVDDNTIRGFFYFGEQEDLSEGEYIERCPAVFNRF